MPHGRTDRPVAFVPGHRALVPTILSRRVSDCICLERETPLPDRPRSPKNEFLLSGRTQIRKAVPGGHGRFGPGERFILPDGVGFTDAVNPARRSVGDMRALTESDSPLAKPARPEPLPARSQRVRVSTQ